MFYHLSHQISKALSEQPSLLEELWEFWKNKYFTPQYGDYQYIRVGGQSMISLQTIVLAFIIGFVLAAVAAIYNKRFLGNFVRTLLSVDAIGPENAKTLEELGYLKNTTIRSALKRGSALRSVVYCVEEQQHLAEVEQKRLEFEQSKTDPRAKFVETPFKLDPSTAHFYIPEQKKYTADIKFEKKGTNWLVFGIVVVGAIALGILAIWLIPDLLQMLDNFIGMFAG